jgi:hypothetical protein
VVSGNGELEPPKGAMPVDPVLVDLSVGDGGHAGQVHGHQHGDQRHGTGELGHGFLLVSSGTDRRLRFGR